MTDGVRGLGRIDRIIWSLIAGVAAFDLVAAPFAGFTVAWHSFLAPLGATAALLAGQFFYRHRRRDLRLAGALGTTAQIIAFAAVAAPLSYLAASCAHFPNCDRWLELADEALGFDWFAILDWLKAHPTLAYILRIIYSTLMLQVLVAVLALALSGRVAELRAFAISFMAMTLVVIALSTPWPAQGPWVVHHLVGKDGLVPPASAGAWPLMAGLRDGTVRTLMAAGADGVITFPSLHMALAVTVTAALWPIRSVRWFVVALNTLMTMSIPIEGSHYLVDMLSGSAVALAAHAFARRLTAPHASPLATARDIGTEIAPASVPLR
ncbi:MAG: phosphatase PAP2 family protein [Proteobacteria bacterium]|nr:phosphatase PAP2 family protein [Pseudomonadota bacterium]